MRLLPYYFAHTFVNALKKIFKTWVAIFIAMILLFGVIGGIVGSVVGSLEDEQEPEEQVEVVTPEEEAAKRENTLKLVETLIGGVVALALIFNFYNGDKSGSNIFMMSDVNFLFSAPMRPQDVLTFRVLLQMGTIAVGSLYLIFQIPNLVLNLKVPILAAVMLIAAWIMTMIIGKMVAVCVYTLTATHTALRRFVRPVAIAAAAAIVIVYGVNVLIYDLAPLDAAYRVFGPGASRFIPVIGWMRGLVMFAVEGNWLGSLICLLANIALCVVFALVIRGIKADFYEDALQGAQTRQDAMEAAKAGTQNSRKRSEKLMRGEMGRGAGGEMFFVKTAYNRRRFAKLGFLTRTGITYLLLCVGGALITRVAAHSSDITILGFAMLVIVFFRNYGNPIAMETALPFLYLMPDSAYKKLACAVLAGTYETALDTIPAFVIASVIVGTPAPTAAVWLLLFITADLFASCTGLLIELVVPEAVVQTVKAMLQMFLKMLAVIPCVIILAVGVVMHWQILSMGIACAVNVGVGAFLFIFCPNLLHRGR